MALGIDYCLFPEQYLNYMSSVIFHVSLIFIGYVMDNKILHLPYKDYSWVGLHLTEH